MPCPSPACSCHTEQRDGPAFKEVGSFKLPRNGCRLNRAFSPRRKSRPRFLRLPRYVIPKKKPPEPKPVACAQMPVRRARKGLFHDLLLCCSVLNYLVYSLELWQTNTRSTSGQQ